MNKLLTAALVPAFVAGATVTTFAAANPFSDVPAGHWAYNSVVKLASEGVIEGYGDGTFLGNRNITRYEMAQMIAKAMAKNPQGANKAELNKLAAEFRSELDSLGVRVDELEKHADMVQWTGEMRYRYWHDKTNDEATRTRSQLQIRLFPTAEINDHWKAKARFTATNDVREDTTSNMALTYIYAEGKYDNFTVNLGKMPLFTNADGGIVADDFFSGAQLIFGDKVKAQLEGGRWSKSGEFAKAADYFGGELLYDDSKFNIGASYRYFKSPDIATRTGDEKANIWSVGAGYKFGGGVKLAGAYAENTKPDTYKRGYNVVLNYKGANRKEAGTWGLYAAYRRIGQNVGLAPTFNTFGRRANKKGVEFGVNWSPLKNTLTELSYFQGKTLDTNKTDKTFFGRASWFF